MSAKEKTMYTAVDAYASKKSATTLGYYEDKYLDYMQQSVSGAKVVRKQPIINRGYYTRVSCFRNIIQNFLDSTKSLGKRQIINIGCGYDTLSFHLLDAGHADLTIFEVDHEDVIVRKTDMIRRSTDLNSLLSGSGDPLGPNYGFETENLKFIAADLQQSTVIESLVGAGLNPAHPTLILSECVLVYMDAACVSSLGTALVSFFGDTSVAWLSYDMFNPTDTFGKMMRSNLESSAGYTIPGFTDFPTLSSHEAKFVDVGFCADTTKACSMLDAYKGMIPDEDKVRLQSIERFDEIEEWELLMSHYSLLLGVKGEALASLSASMP